MTGPMCNEIDAWEKAMRRRLAAMTVLALAVLGVLGAILSWSGS